MASSKERIYAKAVRRAITAVISELNLNETLAVIVRSTARSMKAGASLVLLDANGKKLMHSITWGLPRFYIQKGIPDAHRSLSEVVCGKTIIIEDVSHDSRIQYHRMAINAGIVSIIGTPIIIDGLPIGSIRVYTKQPCECSKQDIGFIETIASLIAIAFKVHLPIKEKNQIKKIKHVQPVTFAHPSEKEFARILDFYNMEWVYEPRSFPLKWNGDRVTEMFTPDFYLPGLDLYVEITTLKQSLVTNKNRKLRKLREMYPDININLLYKNDYNHLLAKYGVGPLSQTRARGIKRILYSADDIKSRVIELAEKISKDYKDRHPILVGIQRGFICFMADLIRQITVPLDLDFIAISYYTGDGDSVVKITKDMDLKIAGRDVIVVEDIVDTGITLNYILNHLKTKKPTSLAICTLLDRQIRRIVKLPIDYTGFELPDEFVVGYGLDYKEEYRNLPFIAIPDIKKPQLKKNHNPP
ncbi:MAG: hypoxanthine phosphoribosyltransferase [Dehalococcoidia bacterium]|nr:MAG: hypoxanthine phosphoribosyltransferase [Dehalococcoidia bacterium]